MISGCLFPAYFIRKTVIGRATGSDLRRDILAALAIGIALAPVIWGGNLLLLTPNLAHWVFFVEHLVIIWAICFMPVLVRHYYRTATLVAEPVADMSDTEVIPADAANDPVPARNVVPLERHLNPDLEGPITRVSAADHQLRIFTDKGETRVRMRFSDALTELEGAPGMQVHRSHWVAYDSIEQLVPEGRRYAAQLLCGGMVPVSASKVPNLEAAGIKIAAE